MATTTTTRTAKTTKTINPNAFEIPMSDNSFNYDAPGRRTLSDLMNGLVVSGSIEDGAELLSILEGLVEKTADSQAKTWQKYEDAKAVGERYTSTHKQSIFLIKLIAARTQSLYNKVQSFQKAGKKASTAQKEELTSHDVLKETWNGGKLSFFDLWALLYGANGGLNEEGKVNPRRHGLLANVQADQMAVLSHNEGYRIRYDRVDYLVDAETVHKLLLSMDTSTQQDGPYGGRCVMVMNEDKLPLVDGKTVILTKGEFTGTVDYASPAVLAEQGIALGEVLNISYKRVRLSLDFSTYKTLFMSQFSGRYGKEGFEAFATILATYFGSATHLPKDRYEAKWFQDLCIALVQNDSLHGYILKSEAATHELFLPHKVFGLRGITEEVLFDKDAYINQMKEREEEARRQRQEGTSGAEMLSQFAAPATPATSQAPEVPQTPEEVVAQLATLIEDHPF